MNFNKILIGAMRLNGPEATAELIKKGIDYGFNYIDTAPLYQYSNPEENSETWVGRALKQHNNREKVMLSAKCATSDGGLGLGEFKKDIGFGVRTAEEFALVFQQSLDRLQVSALDFYHLWICHTEEQFKEAMKPGGWYEGLQKEREAGRVKHLGITTHADADTIIRFLETGLFESVTLPFNVLNRTRMKAVEFCAAKNIKVFAMNPLGGGFLTADEKLKELAFKYLLSIENVHLLVGFKSAEEVEYAQRMKVEYEAHPQSTESILEEVKKIITSDEPRCTACGYCQPCPQFIDIGASLSHYNFYKYLGMTSAKETFGHLQWNPRYNLNNCTACGQCEKRCPNMLPVRQIIQDAKALMY